MNDVHAGKPSTQDDNMSHVYDGQWWKHWRCFWSRTRSFNSVYVPSRPSIKDFFPPEHHWWDDCWLKMISWKHFNKNAEMHFWSLSVTNRVIKAISQVLAHVINDRRDAIGIGCERRRRHWVKYWTFIWKPVNLLHLLKSGGCRYISVFSVFQNFILGKMRGYIPHFGIHILQVLFPHIQALISVLCALCMRSCKQIISVLLVKLWSLITYCSICKSVMVRQEGFIYLFIYLMNRDVSRQAFHPLKKTTRVPVLWMHYVFGTANCLCSFVHDQENHSWTSLQ